VASVCARSSSEPAAETAETDADICYVCEMGVLLNGYCSYCDELHERELTAAYDAAVRRPSSTHSSS